MPPVTVRHLIDSENSSCANAIVSIRKVCRSANGEEPDHRRDGCGYHDADQKADPPDQPNLLPEDHDRIGRDAEERRVTERQQPRVTDEEVEAHREDREDQHFGGKAVA